jgi:hypothetical protein
MKSPADVAQGIAIVYAPSRLEGLRRRWGTLGQAKFVIQQAQRASELAERSDAPPVEQVQFEEYEAEATVFNRVLSRLKDDLLALDQPLRLVERLFLSTFDFRSTQCIVVVGQDGLVANTAKYSLGCPIVAINPDPTRIDGILLPFSPAQAVEAVRTTLTGKSRIRQVTLAEARLGDGQRLLAFNDLFIGARTHISARYRLQVGGVEELHSSSGVIVSTGAGSTGWLSSVFNQAQGLQQRQGTEQTITRPELRWDSEELCWVAREPFVSRRSTADHICGRLKKGEELILESLMPEQGVVFSDGIEADFLAFNSGTIVRIGVSDERAELVQ